MSLGQHILSSFEGTQITQEVKHLILKEKILGFTLFKWNIENAEQLIELNKELQSLANQASYQLILAVDHEGGRVFRLPEPFSQIKPMREWGNYFNNTSDVEPHFQLGRILASEIKAAGFNLNFAPVIDVDTNEKNPVIGDRSFSKNAEIVYKISRQVIRGLIHEGVIPCLKHFPGHGGTSQDSHDVLPVDNREADIIQKVDLLPYHHLIAEHLAPTIMTAHVIYPKLDPNHPATLSKHIIQDWLRNEMNYEGIVFSDDLLMKAIADNYEIHDAAKQFFQCGGDVILICKQPELAQEVIDKLKSDKDLIENHLKISRQRISNMKKIFSVEPTDSNDLLKIIKKNQDFLSEFYAKL